MMEDAQVISTPKRGKSNAPIVALGILGLCGVAALTFTATKMVVEKVNHNADIAYYNTYTQYANSRSIPTGTSETETTDETTSSIVVTGYQSEDLVEIDGDWYIISSLVNDYKDAEDGNEIPILVDPTNTIFVEGIEYMHIDNPESLEATAGGNNVPFYGTEYVVVDIDGNMVYLVEKGDTLSEVSGRVGYSVQELAEFNSIKNVNLIYAGQTLRVPAPQEAIDYVKSQGGTSVTEEVKTEEETEESAPVKEEVSDETVVDEKSTSETKQPEVQESKSSGDSAIGIGH